MHSYSSFTTQEIQNKFYKKKRTEIKSSLGDPVTETDKLIEKMFVTTIKEKYPDHRLVVLYDYTAKKCPKLEH